MLLERKLKYISRFIYIFSTLFLLITGIIEASIYKIGIRVFGYEGEYDLLIVVTVMITITLVFIIDFLRYKFEWLLLRIIISTLVIFSALIIYAAPRFYGENKLLFYETPYQDTLFFVSEYIAGGLHNPIYSTTVYRQVAPLTYDSLGKINNMRSWLQDVTIEQSEWFVVESHEDYVIIEITDDVDGEKIIYQQTFVFE